MITAKEAFERGFAVQTYSIKHDQYIFTYKNQTFTLPHEPFVTNQLVRIGDLMCLPVNYDFKWVDTEK